MSLLLKEWKRLYIKDGILYCSVQDGQRETIEQLVLPEKLQRLAKTTLHDDLGHFGSDRTFALIRVHLYWP